MQPPGRRTSRSSDGTLLDRLLSRRLLFVAGKGGTGKSTTAAALALLAARRGKRVLCIDVDAKGDVARCLGADEVGFAPKLVQPNISVLALHPEESLQEYLKVYLKIPRLVRLTPLARVFDFLATGVPGAKDMLVVGKIAFEEKRRDRDGVPTWDIIIVDSSASGHALPQIGAARAMLEVVRGGGIIRSQVEWIDAILSDPERTLLTVCALPEEMPVTETVELQDEVLRRGYISLGACFLNRVFPVAVGEREQRVAAELVRAPHPVPGASDFHAGVRFAGSLHAESVRWGRQLRSALNVPVVEVPFAVARAGLATTRAVAESLADGERTA